jgi:hypothetical protein
MLVTTAGAPARETAGWTYRTTGAPLSELGDDAGDDGRDPLAIEDLAAWLASAALGPVDDDSDSSRSSSTAVRLVRVGPRL